MNILDSIYLKLQGLPGGSGGKESAAVQETQVRSLGQEDPLEKGMATHSSVLAWRIPWTEEPGGLEIPMDRGAWWAIVHGVEKSQTRLSN